jgi:hypothetical protein
MSVEAVCGGMENKVQSEQFLPLDSEFEIEDIEHLAFDAADVSG